MADDATDTTTDQVEAVGLGPLFRELYFPTQVFFRDLPGAALFNPHLITAVRALRATDEAGIVRSNVRELGGWHSQNTLQDDPDFDEFRQAVLGTGAEMAVSLGYDPSYPLVFDNMWAIINPPGGYNRSHIHPGCLWSGVYFLQAPSQAGRIVFTDPRTVHLQMPAAFIPSKPRTAENWTEVYFEPKPGRMVLFPSWLYHTVEPNLSEETGAAGERIVLSFNLIQRKLPQS